MTEKIKKVWKDPVGSKLISAGIIGLLSIIYFSLKSLYNDKSFIENLKGFVNYQISILHLIFILLGILIVWIIWIVIKKNRRPKSAEYTESHKVLDFELFDRIKTDLLPPNGTIAFLRHNNFAGFAFRIDNLDDIYKFEYEFTKPDFEFIEPEMENILRELKKHTAEFTSLIGLNTWSTSNKNINANTVPPEWEIEQPEKFRDIVNKIHTETRGICSNYDKLIKAGRRKLTE
ncbi:hypothetical protein ACFSX9_03905 [Flavobacterium ardleyense]|uniref:Uncharacterized protein n=1 Tax=Flavobacterium ardleyense TaxID=2038737 RepID=A0ABW5Z4X9_9FLAO